MTIWHLLFLSLFVIAGMVFAGKLRGLPGLRSLPQY